MANKVTARCEDCIYFDFDEDYDDYICTQSLDEDQLDQRRPAAAKRCPYIGYYQHYKPLENQNATKQVL